jgi:hypothetical protein
MLKRIILSPETLPHKFFDYIELSVNYFEEPMSFLKSKLLTNAKYQTAEEYKINMTTIIPKYYYLNKVSKTKARGAVSLDRFFGLKPPVSSDDSLVVDDQGDRWTNRLKNCDFVIFRSSCGVNLTIYHTSVFLFLFFLDS